MKTICARISAIIVVACLALQVLAQDSGSSAPGQNTNPQTEAPEIKGFNEYENFRGMVNHSGSLLKLDSSLGYDFNSHVGVFAGVPLYFANDTSNTQGQTRIHDMGAGDAYFGAEAFAPSKIVNYSSRLTISAPTGSVSKGFSPGQPTIDWNNRFRRRFGRLAPFVAAGVGNTVPDSELVTRNFISVGNVSHFEEGAELDVVRRVYIGSSAYQIVPFGEQKIFNRFETVVPRDGEKGPGNHQGDPAPNLPPPGNGGQPSATGNDLTREHGFDAWLGFEPTRVLRMELGYSRSVTFNLNSFSFNVGLNVGRLIRSTRSQ
ncbi:MAG TPA: hypothetical protein VKL99_09765 [Candidatus Angelobacter sp.]|nr:hypothetical protein [Candidatus Angelobacter sp.]